MLSRLFAVESSVDRLERKTTELFSGAQEHAHAAAAAKTASDLQKSAISDLQKHQRFIHEELSEKFSLADEKVNDGLAEVRAELFEGLEKQAKKMEEQCMPAAKEILLVAEHLELANTKLNQYSDQVDTKLGRVEERLLGLERKAVDEPLVKLRKEMEGGDGLGVGVSGLRFLGVAVFRMIFNDVG